jgi:hypothetical protein
VTYGDSSSLHYTKPTNFSPHTVLTSDTLHLGFPIETQLQKQTNSVACGPQANYSDWATATGRRNIVPTFVDRGLSRGQCGRSPTAVNLSFVDRSRYFSFQVAPHLSSQGLSGPRSRPTATQKFCYRRESNPRPLCLQPGTLTTRPQMTWVPYSSGPVWKWKCSKS